MLMTAIPYMGEICSLLSAIFWALAIIIFKKIGDRVSPMVINPVKSIIGLSLFILTCLIMGVPLMPNSQFSNTDLLILSISGIIGIGIADIIFLHSLNILGAGISAIVDTVYSPFVILFAFILLGESLTFTQLIGGALIIGSVLYASTKIQNIPVDRKRFKQGILYGIGSIAMMALGIVMIKPILNTVSDNVGLQLWIAGYRLVSGVLVSGSIMLIANRKQNILRALRDRTLWLPLIVSSVLAAYLGIAMWVMGMSMTTASISSILNQTATIFILIFAWIFLGEPLTKRRILSIVVAMCGAYLVFIG
jgi:drug/metabolite transporter (DMT)-like permease|tara:strand:- start:1012 stop:1932 length:921 start_codon:yes stop_codon:yes gene_type:complete